MRGCRQQAEQGLQAAQAAVQAVQAVEAAQAAVQAEEEQELWWGQWHQQLDPQPPPSMGTPRPTVLG